MLGAARRAASTSAMVLRPASFTTVAQVLRVSLTVQWHDLAALQEARPGQADSICGFCQDGAVFCP